MKVVNEKLELVETEPVTLNDVLQKHRDKRIFVELKGVSAVLPLNSTLLVVSDPNYGGDQSITPKALNKTGKKRADRRTLDSQLDDSQLIPLDDDGEDDGNEPNGVDLESDEQGSARKLRKERKKGVTPTKRKSSIINLKDILTKKGTNRFRPMNDKTVEDILTLVLQQKDEIKGWTEYHEMLRIVENLVYLLDKHRKTLADAAALKKEEVTEEQQKMFDEIEVFVEEIWKIVEATPRPQDPISLDSVEMSDGKNDVKKRKREDDDDFDLLTKKMEIIRSKRGEKSLDPSSGLSAKAKRSRSNKGEEDASVSVEVHEESQGDTISSISTYQPNKQLEGNFFHTMDQ